MSFENVIGILHGFGNIMFGDMLSEGLIVIVAGVGLGLVVIPMIVIWFTGRGPLEDAKSILEER